MVYSKIMKSFEEMGVKIPEILLPKNLDVSTWSVVACDQYTQDRNYWNDVEKIADGKVSTLNLILPEVYLNDADKPNKIEKIRENMKKYLSDGVFDSEKKEFIYIERKTAYGRIRHGLICAVDLETYEWKPFSKALIRATEATIVERIPPRMEIRRNAPIESPHIMLLVNDKDKILVEGTGNLVKNKKETYSGDLMKNSGSIKGWDVSSDSEIEYVRSSLEKIAEKNKCADGSTFLFAVGDGNHSLATAKAVWDEYKTQNPGVKDSSVRYALVEIVNIYDSGLTFEPIHRVLFNVDSKILIKDLKEKFNAEEKILSTKEELIESVKNSKSNFGFTFTENGQKNFVLLSTKINGLAVSAFQPALDEFIKSSNSEIDYIHGEDEILRLAEKSNTCGILLPPVEKDSFFNTINEKGPLPRKSFSMGEADEKRFYLECRKLFTN